MTALRGVMIGVEKTGIKPCATSMLDDQGLDLGAVALTRREPLAVSSSSWMHAGTLALTPRFPCNKDIAGQPSL